ncbi:MAG: replication initiation factor domain-containing protein, partial [Nitrospirota bacterium]|nr:replication initiation factor domain-containing protein [Nitrospirota bacterium]
RVKTVLDWINEHQGHVTRFDCALDDRASQVTLEHVKAAVAAGQCLTRARQFRLVAASDLNQGTATGETLYFGSPTSQTLLRVYDKRLEMQHKERENWQDYGIRWELELKKERAQACTAALRGWEEAEWRRYLISVLRAHINFRDTTRDEPDWVRCRAPLLPWWALLTEGLETCRLVVEQDVRTIEDLKDWVARALGPTLAVLYEEAGSPWMAQMIEDGKRRWRPHHRRLLTGTGRNHTYGLRPSKPPV